MAGFNAYRVRPKLMLMIIAALAVILAVFKAEFHRTTTDSSDLVNDRAIYDGVRVLEAIDLTSTNIDVVSDPLDLTERTPATFAERGLDKRVLTWAQAMRKGQGNLLAMSSSDLAFCQPPSRWTDYNALGSYGWKMRDLTQSNTPAQYAVAMRGLTLNAVSLSHPWPNGISLVVTRPEDNVIVVWVQRKLSTVTYTPQGSNIPVQYNPTGGQYGNIYNVIDGVIIARENFGPDAMSRNDDSFQGEVVPLKQWSDVTFLEWQNQCTAKNKRVGNINYIVRSNVRGVDVINTIFTALENARQLNGVPPAWTQRVTFVRPNEGEAAPNFFALYVY
ncbi:hypothetical protein LTR36_002190 [Oleoguttula mirabilis]|uniref:Uncharacterized protein n=1 Tax=Oleoguttula mirabilis TaxID=1507867 RepID=A0AAV9JND5_9PEZI|nr:hypothetical protein LTR36_002190 [Oleoguttula mirabilis]